MASSQIWIDPRTLRRLREAKGWTRQRLEDVSGITQRHIARIESATSPSWLRRITYDCLREAVGAEFEWKGALEEVDTTQRFDGGALKWHRERGKLSRKKLADISGVSARQIERLEQMGEEASPRAITVMRLAKALNLKAEALSSCPQLPALNFDELIKRRPPKSRFSPRVGLAYELTARRYGISEEALLGLAPMLFVLLAEGSLLWRRHLLKEMCGALDTTDQLFRTHSHLWFGFRGDHQDWGAEAERESIERLDLIGSHAAEGVGDEYSDRVEAGITPFLNYLRTLESEIGDKGVIDLDQVSASDGFGMFCDGYSNTGYKVCEAELQRLTGDSEKAMLALRTGSVTIADIPEQLLADESAQERVAWLEAKLKPEVEEAFAQIDAFGHWWLSRYR